MESLRSAGKPVEWERGRLVTWGQDRVEGSLGGGGPARLVTRGVSVRTTNSSFGPKPMQLSEDGADRALGR